MNLPLFGFGNGGGPSMGGLNRLGFRTFDSMRSNDARMLDSAGTFLESELERLDPILHLPLAGFTYSRDVPLRTDVTIADESSSFANLGFAGPGGITPNGISWIGKTTTAFPGISVDVGKTVTPLNLWGEELGYTIPELESSLRVNRPIDQQKLAGLNLKANQDVDQIAYIGDPTIVAPGQNGGYGLLNNPDVTPMNASAGAKGSPAFAQKTVTEIMADFNVVLAQVFLASGQTVNATKVGLPATQFFLLQQTNSTAGTVSLLEYLKKNNAATANTGIELDIVIMKYATGQGVGGTDRMVAYCQDETRVRLPITPMQNTPVQYRGIHYLTYYYRRIGSVEFTNSQLVGYLDGI